MSEVTNSYRSDGEDGYTLSAEYSQHDEEPEDEAPASEPDLETPAQLELDGSGSASSEVVRQLDNMLLHVDDDEEEDEASSASFFFINDAGTEGI